MIDTQEIHSLLSSESNSCSNIFNCENVSYLRRLLRIWYVFKFIQISMLRIIYSEGPVIYELIANKLGKSQFGLFLDNERVWRWRWWLVNAKIPQSITHPVLLNAKHYLTSLIVQECLDTTKQNITKILIKLWSRMWIKIKNSLSQCGLSRGEFCF